jgi:hypothetical protein
MSSVENVLLAALVKLVRQVPWGPSRSDLETRSEELRQESAFEHGWDNYTTAADLGWKAGLHRLAAEARFPRDGDRLVRSLREDLFERLVFEVSCWNDDSDVGEVTRKTQSALSMAICAGLTDDVLDSVIDELALGGHLQDDPDHLKRLYRGQEQSEKQHLGVEAFPNLLGM